MKFNFRSWVPQVSEAVRVDVRARVKAGLTAGAQIKAGLMSRVDTAKSRLVTGIQTLSATLRLQLSRLTKLSPQSLLLRLIAIGSTALIVGLIITSIHLLVDREPLQTTAVTPTPTPTVTPVPSPHWAGLPIAPSPQPAAPTAPPTAKSATKSNSQPSALSESAPTAAKPANPLPPAIPPTQSLSPVPPALLAQTSSYAPPQQSAPADPSNYGDRYAKDIFGNPVNNAPLIVLHETVGTADSAIHLFQTAHTDESLQASYHSIIRRDGTIIYIVPPDKRAFGAGNSVFKSNKGEEAVHTHQQFPPSVNNFAYHISLESPPDGDNSAETHSGYTEAQYQSLAWLVAQTSVSDDRITTHRDIDRSGSRIDPRSFDAQRFYTYLRSLPRPYLN